MSKSGGRLQLRWKDLAAMRKIMIVGARPNSLGQHIGLALEKELPSYEYVTAGIEGEDYSLDLFSSSQNDMSRLIRAIGVTDIVVTAGINEGRGLMMERKRWTGHMNVNVIGPMVLLEAFVEEESRRKHSVGYDAPSPGQNHFVVISSNSAHIPRSGSGPYCASKAALSMAVRCAARDLRGLPSVYGYEPGLLYGTPMTKEVRSRLGNDVPLTRMRECPEGISPVTLARMVARNLVFGGVELNGCLLRVDNGEV